MKNAMQFKAHIKKLAQQKGLSAQLILQNHMMERLLERISRSSYRKHWILKGGFLLASMLGLDTRATMDMDATIKGFSITEERLEAMMKEILSISLDDGISFQYLGLEDIRENDEYGGYRISLHAQYFSLKVPLKIDITLGDTITPQEIIHSFKLMLEERSIPILAYNIETLLAEKLETIFSRSTLNTRPRDFYDVYILTKLRKEEININHLAQALTATATKRITMTALQNHRTILSSIEASESMQQHWSNYQKDFSYAAEISFSATCSSIRALMNELPEI